MNITIEKLKLSFLRLELGERASHFEKESNLRFGLELSMRKFILNFCEVVQLLATMKERLQP